MSDLFYDQSDFDIRCDWGVEGVEHLAPDCDVVIVVDVLSFTTAVDIAVERGAAVYPYRWRDGTAEEYARSVGAILAGERRGQGYSLSPASLLQIAPGTRLILPSPNGATISLAAGRAVTLAGCLRNAQAVAEFACQCGEHILVAPAGERWPASQAIRPAFEDLVGAGAIIHFLTGTKSPEAEAAEAVYQHHQKKLADSLFACSSGRELTEKGFLMDVQISAAFNVSRAAPRLIDGCFTWINS